MQLNKFIYFFILSMAATFFISTRSGFRACLDIVRYSRKAGAAVGIWHQKACDNANQLWELDSSAADSSMEGVHILRALRDSSCSPPSSIPPAAAPWRCTLSAPLEMRTHLVSGGA
jgi:hypothetical protein